MTSCGGTDGCVIHAEEEALDPDQPIIDPHLHLWDIPATEGGLQEPQTFLIGDAASTIDRSGHRVTHTVFVECHAKYREHGPEVMRSLGETEFAIGMAAMAETGLYGSCQIAHRVVANVDLCGNDVVPVLEAHLAVAGRRLRGVRMNTSYSAAGLFGSPAEEAAATRLSDPRFIVGASALASLDWSLDVWCLHPQLPQLIELARTLPELLIVLDHSGTLDLRGPYFGKDDDAFADWQRDMAALASLPNVRVKISGLGMDVSRPLQAATGSTSSAALADAWRSRVEVAIDKFGPSRCMFASNYPPERSAGTYGAIWNAFKRLGAPYTETERDCLFRLTAADTYRIEQI